MKNIFAIFLFFISINSSATVYYVSHPDSTYAGMNTASDANAGTFLNPFATWQKAFDTAEPADTVYYRAGVWKPTSTTFQSSITLIDPQARAQSGNPRGNSGTAANPIWHLNYPNETPILDCELINNAENYAIALGLNDIHHVYFRGFTIRNNYQRVETKEVQGISTYLCSNLHFENITVHDIGGRAYWYQGNVGIDLSSYGVPDITYDTTYFINCDAYQLCDSLAPLPADQGNNADGWKTDVEAGGVLIFEGCRVWNSSDDGFDCSGPGVTILRNCWAYYTGWQIDGNGAGVGFKQGGTRDDTVAYTTRLLENCIAAGNRNLGIQDLDYAPYYRTNMVVYNMVFYGNDRAFSGAGLTGNETKPFTTSVWRNNIAYNSTSNIGAYWAGIPSTYYSSTYQSNNTFTYSGGSYTEDNPAYTVTNADFISVDPTELIQSRQSDGSLPDINFMHLSEGSDLIGAGTDVGMSSTPDIGVDWAYLGASTPTGSTRTTVFAFYFQEAVGIATIDTINHTIAVNVKRDCNTGSLTGTATLTSGATCDANGQALSYITPRTITITAADEVTEQEYTVTVTKVGVFHSSKSRKSGGKTKLDGENRIKIHR